MNPTYEKHTLLTDKVSYVRIKLKNQLKLHSTLPVGTKAIDRIRDFDWGVVHSAFQIVDGVVYSASKSFGIFPKVYLENVNSEMLEDFNAKKFCL